MNAKLKNGCIVLTSETPAEFFDLREWADRIPVEDYKPHPFKKGLLGQSDYSQDRNKETMKEEPITVGDMAMTVRLKPCCGQGQLGFVMTVAALYIDKVATCMHCGEKHTATYAMDEQGEIVRLSRLKRIPPTEEVEHEHTTDEVQV